MSVLRVRDREPTQVRQASTLLAGQRKSVPSLMLVARKLTRVLKDRYATEPATSQYLERVADAQYGDRLKTDNAID
jgi:hypothetical protein